MYVALLFAFGGVLLLLHHGWKHYYEASPSHAREESCVWVCYFQPKDILHFESASMVCLTCAFSVGLISDLGGDSGLLSIVAVFLCVMGALLMMIACLNQGSDIDASGYQFHNICNHETWIVVCITNARVWGILAT
jgi:hypothetical protein